MSRRFISGVVLAGTALLALAACGSADNSTPSNTAANSAPGASPAASASPSLGASPAASAAALPAECVAAQLKTAQAKKLTIATDEPVYAPWMLDNNPSSGKGYESAVAYAVADRLGYTKDQVDWKRVRFDEAVNSQEGWDFDINQFTITPEKAKVVDFSTGYYDLTQVVIAIKGSKIASATSIADVKNAKLGAMIGTTSLEAINKIIAPAEKPGVFNDNSLAMQALQNGQIDGLVVDSPTAFYMTGSQLEDGVVVGQLAGGEKEQLGLLLAKDSPLTTCVSAAVDSLRADGSLAKFAAEWLAGTDAAPVLK